MNEATEPINTSDTPKCPVCGYITFTREDMDRYCMECGEERTTEECEI